MTLLRAAMWDREPGGWFHRGFYPATSDSPQPGFVDPSTDAMWIVANALRWVGGNL